VEFQLSATAIKVMWNNGIHAVSGIPSGIQFNTIIIPVELFSQWNTKIRNGISSRTKLIFPVEFSSIPLEFQLSYFHSGIPKSEMGQNLYSTIVSNQNSSCLQLITSVVNGTPLASF
jgi:hypothetical protein